MPDETDTCDLCGDPITAAAGRRVPASQSEAMGLDEGTIVHRSCYEDSRPHRPRARPRGGHGRWER